MTARRSLALLLAGMSVLGCLPAALTAHGIAPFESPPSYEAGMWNATVTDPYSVPIKVVIYYPAQAEGWNATPATGDAPYPLVVFLHDDNITPPAEYYGSYGVFLAQRGYVVALPDLSPHAASPDAHARMANATLATVFNVTTLNGTAGALLQGMVDGGNVAVVGHGVGARIALLAALLDGGFNIDAVAGLGLVDATVGGAPAIAPRMGEVDVPLHLQGGSNDTVADQQAWTRALAAKAMGYSSLLVMNGGNHVQYEDKSHPNDPAGDGPGGINRTRQHSLADRFLLAFLDFHLKHDALSMSRLYGAEAAADLHDHVLTVWDYGVLDESVEFTAPADGSTVREGYTDFCITVTDGGAFPMPKRNVTFQLARVEGPGLVVVYPKENQTAAALAPGSSDVLGWSVMLTKEGDYRAFATMGDPDHIALNDRAVLGFTVSLLQPPAIEHTPPQTAELGVDIAITATITSPSGVAMAWVNYTDPDGFVVEAPLAQQGTTDMWGVDLPAPMAVGEISYAIHVLAGNGATNATARYHLPVVDTTPPAISHTPPGLELHVRQRQEMCATVVDLGEVSRVNLAYDEPGLGFHNASCGRRGDVWFYPLDLGPNAGFLAYTWWAQDAWGNSATLGPFTLPVVDRGPPTIVPQDPGKVEMGAEVRLFANVTDDAMVASVWVNYLAPGSTIHVNATPILQGALWRLIIPPIQTFGTLAYEWGAVDINGNVATTGALHAEVADSRPPTVADVLFGDATVGSSPWVEASVSDAGGLGAVLLTFTDVNGTPGQTSMRDLGNGTYRGELPPQGRGGEVKFKVVATDLSGNVGDSGSRSMVVRDVTPPTITHQQPNAPVQGSPVTLKVTVTDDVGVARVFLDLKLSPQSSFQRIEMVQSLPGLWELTVNGSQVEPPEIVYYFEATDLAPSSNVARDPANATSFYRLVVSPKVLNVHGYVKDTEGRPVAGASVVVIGTDLEDTTRSDGSYRIGGLLPGTHTIWVSAKGLREVRLDVTLSTAQPDKAQNFTLSPEPAPKPAMDQNYWYAGVGVLLLVLAVAIVAVRLRGRGRR